MKKLFDNKLFLWIVWTFNIILALIGRPVGFGFWFGCFLLWIIYADKSVKSKAAKSAKNE